MATDRVLFSLLERAGQLLREGTTPAYANFTKPELLEFAATARALAAGAEAEIEVTTLRQRVLNYYTINGTSDEGCNMNDVAAGLGMLLGQVQAAVDLLSDEGQLYSTIDEDHHKFTAIDSEEELPASDDDFEMGETLSEEERARRAKAKAEREGNVQDISDDGSDVEDGALTPLQDRVIDYYIEYAPRRRPELGLAINAVAAGLRIPVAQLRTALNFLRSEGHLYSTIDDDHHKATAE